MKIGIVGGGITGLTAAYQLSKKGHKVSVFEENAELGGQMATFEVGENSLERFYHHIFTSDVEIIRLIGELGLSQMLRWLDSRVGIYYKGKVYPFATPMDLIHFAPLSLISRIRLGLISLWLRCYRNWHKIEEVTARDWIIKYAGRSAFEVVWEPLLKGKFGERSNDVGMVWFWGKIHLRMASRGRGMQKEKLGYLMGSFGLITSALAECIRSAQGEIYTHSTVEHILVEGNRTKGIKVGDKVVLFDAVIAAVPSPIFHKLSPQLPPDYAQKLDGVQYQAAACLVLIINRLFTPFYWINISDSSIPFVATVEHTNFVDETHYGGNRVLYVSNYLSPDSPLYKKNASELLAEYLPHLRKMNPAFNTDWVKELYLFREEAGQPIIGTNYSRQIPALGTPIERLYLANTTQIYPEDRGMNYSVHLGEEVANLVDKDLA